METFELPENIKTVITTLDIGNKEFAWTLYQGEHRISLSLIWTKTKSKSGKNGASHSTGALVTKSSLDHVNNQSRIVFDPTTSSRRPDGNFHSGSPTVESANLAPPPRGHACKSKKRHKTPSQYRRDKRRLAEFKRSKRQKDLHVCDKTPAHDQEETLLEATENSSVPEPKPSEQVRVDILNLLLPPPISLPTKALSDLSELDPLHTPSITICRDEPPSQASQDLLCLELPGTNLIPDTVSLPVPPSTDDIMDKVGVAASAIADVNRLASDPGVTRDMLRNALGKANDTHNAAKLALKDSQLSACAINEALQSLNAAFEKAARSVICIMDTPLDGGSKNAIPQLL